MTVSHDFNYLLYIREIGKESNLFAWEPEKSYDID